jgi:hypothetical protein
VCSSDLDNGALRNEIPEIIKSLREKWARDATGNLLSFEPPM